MKINRNILWTETFVNELFLSGVKYVCISPGSRNTPLTFAFANNKNIKSFVHIDERSCAFFAVGLAKSSGTPVALVSTSGTAAAEFYPAIIEAYQQRIPLIVCTADRPPELLDRGANQTINQINLYKNHIRWFIDVGLPEAITEKIKFIKSAARKSVYKSWVDSKGPVHLNFPFRKPFEPDAFTDEVKNDLIDLSKSSFVENNFSVKKETRLGRASQKWFMEILNYLKKYEKGLIIAGPENYDPQFHKYCKILAEKLGYPILADGASQLRFGKQNKENILSNFEGILRSSTFSDNNQPEIILQFGRTVTSKALENYLKKCNSIRFMINEFGDWFDPDNKATGAIACRPFLFCKSMIEAIDKNKIERKTTWLKNFICAETISAKIKRETIYKSKFPNESRIIKEILDVIPENSNIMISNSMPIRDFDYFAYKTEKDLAVYNNRGASGIDGIISTALGVQAESKKTTILLTGDLAFYYDLNGLLAAKKYYLQLIIILINNNGGGIFEVLPISKYKNIFKEYFITPHSLEFSNFVKAYNGKYKLIKSWEDFRNSFNQALRNKTFFVLEVKTDASKSLLQRENYWKEVTKNL